MRKLLVAVCLVSMVFATTAIAAETYTEKFVQSKTQKIVDAEKKARAQQAENEKKAKAAREAQARVEARIKEIEAILANYELIKDKVSTKTVQVGAKVTINMIDFDEKDTYEIVGVIEANPMENKLSSESPLAKAVLGHKVGDIVEVEVAKPYKVEILGIEKN